MGMDMNQRQMDQESPLRVLPLQELPGGRIEPRTHYATYHRLDVEVPEAPPWRLPPLRPLLRQRPALC